MEENISWHLRSNIWSENEWTSTKRKCYECGAIKNDKIVYWCKHCTRNKPIPHIDMKKSYKPTDKELEEMGFMNYNDRFDRLEIDDEVWIDYYHATYYFILSFDDWCGNYFDRDIFPKSKQDLLTLISILKE